MKKLITHLALLTLLFLISNQSFAQIVQENGALSVQGNKIVNEHGAIVSFAGVSMYWSEPTWGNPTKYWNRNVVNWLVDDWNAQIIRLAISTADESGQNDGWMRNANLQRGLIDEMVNACINKGIYVIIDWHAHYAYLHENEVKDFFREMIDKYGNYKNVIWEIWNEPKNDVDWDGIVKPYAERVIDVIRNEKHNNNLIIVGNPWWDQNLNDVARNPIYKDNIAYAFHFYEGQHDFNSLTGNVQQALNANLAVFASEWGIWDAGNFSGTSKWYEFLRQNDISNCIWELHDNGEVPSILKNGASSNGGWTSDQLTDWGNGMREVIKNWIPQSCSAISVPATIEAENYCSQSGIKKENCSEGGENVGYIDAGDWIVYKVNVPAAGTYTVSYRVASLNGGGSFQLEAQGGSPVYGSMNVQSTGGWQNWTTISHDVQLPAGIQNLAIAAISGGWNINKFSISSSMPAEYTLSTTITGSGSGTITLNPAGGTYQAGTQVTATANASSGSNFVGWSGDVSSTSTSITITMNGNKSISAEFSGGSTPEIHIEAEDYDVMSGIQTENCSEGTLNVGWIDAGDWMAYNDINIPTSGTYTVEYRVASLNGGGTLRLEQNSGATLLGQIDIPVTSGWQNWTTISQTVNLNAGVQNFGLAAGSGGFNINWFKFKSGTKSALVETQTKLGTPDSFDDLFKVFPNPAVSVLKIRGLAHAKSIVVCTLSGQELINKKINGENETLINVEALNEGIYFLKVFQADSVYSTKFVKN